MGTDLALDTKLNDLIVTPSNDFALVSGTDEIDQRIKVFLKVQLGSWDLDPTFGSGLSSLSSMPVYRVLDELPLVVKEALAQMDDIRVLDVMTSVDEDSSSKVGFVVTYVVTDGVSEGDEQVFSDSITVAG